MHEKESILLPESTHYECADYVHQIHISNNEKHIMTVTVDGFIVNSVDLKGP